jgi:hypothetical protein
MRPACPNVITLNHYVSGALEESKAEEIAEHLALCDRCQNRSDEMASETDGLIGAVRRGAVAASKNDEPQLARLMTEALNVGASPNSNSVDGDSRIRGFDPNQSERISNPLSTVCEKAAWSTKRNCTDSSSQARPRTLTRSPKSWSNTMP